ncbi:hypothetical protein [Agrobacterium larrymoorei]|uniref:Uncharacterized protein n=1 Tax=Agrobacterium larrymoorei TaxID=160699 RepID=A0A4D7E1F8_9HYPH|nr:hypothetical protein [Agrobacterium larrymoorei]QCJ01065.1 hypothetical protein CFBP5473_24255 [Agrobacterium larrymoorei]QYA10082.1 hypothetical protein J5285_22910 [Agrobacterium larrymoorei]
MSKNLNGDIILPSTTSRKEDVIRVERVWQHRHNLELRTQKPRQHRVLTLAFGTGVLLLGATCMLANGDLSSRHATVLNEAMASYPAPQESAKVSTKFQHVEDVTLRQLGGADTQPVLPTYSVVPIRRPANANMKPRGSGQTDQRVSALNAASVLRYDRCAPDCETRDTLVVGTVPTISAAPHSASYQNMETEPTNKAVEVGKAAINGAGFVLVQTAALPFKTLKLGRDAVIKLSEMD